MDARRSGAAGLRGHVCSMASSMWRGGRRSSSAGSEHGRQRSLLWRSNEEGDAAEWCSGVEGAAAGSERLSRHGHQSSSLQHSRLGMRGGGQEC